MPEETREDARFEGRDEYDMDVDRMINEGLGGGRVTLHNGKITETTTDFMERDEP
jgi:hypothetical protein